MKLTLVAAVAKNGVIGASNALPWYIPEDLKHFKQVSTGKTVLMGRNTFDSIMERLKKPLPDRINVVVTRNLDFKAPDGVLVFRDLDSALTYLSDRDEVIVAGGGQIYSQTINRADKLILTEVDKEMEGDVYFPEYDKTDWKETQREDMNGFSWVEYERK